MNKTRLDAVIREQENLPTLERADIEAMQLNKLNRVLRQEKMRKGYYKELPDMLRTLEELQNLPFTTSWDLAKYADKMVLCSQSRIQRVITDRTSGTTGVPKRMYYTPQDLKNTVALFEAGLGEFVYQDSVTMIAMPFSGPFGLGELIAEAITNLGAVPVKCGPGLTFEEYKKIMEEKKPDTYVGTPVQLLSIIRSVGCGSLKRALVSADACPDHVIHECERYLGTRLFPHYGSREMALGGAVTCEAHNGMHLRENHLIAEIVDKKGRVLPAGEMGELVITTIGMEAQPLIRYKTGDLTRILPGKCDCGSCLVRIDKVQRIHDSKMEEMDNLVFSFMEVIDYSVEKCQNTYEFEILLKEKIPETALKEKLQRLLPDQKILIRCKTYTKKSKSLYTTKRHIQVRN